MSKKIFSVTTRKPRWDTLLLFSLLQWYYSEDYLKRLIRLVFFVAQLLFGHKDEVKVDQRSPLLVCCVGYISGTIETPIVCKLGINRHPLPVLLT